MASFPLQIPHGLLPNQPPSNSMATPTQHPPLMDFLQQFGLACTKASSTSLYLAGPTGVFG
eukprot:CAMPEP_0201690226 /NCGR_PEP_ID=MMETSP0578-20130828/3695_1 /ASSEMBLY_ACC=CAM_ASM_000663 /TAXON_ID=267565 /ORGANISM="Skeletonema grethea, Strain CCMP 1804" /LENGTH=60 /DNA_ID=CAMNT_0048175133 /DNA_START=127 /DNA_END=306 /DNA_ORIENTATION=+